jgi:hypothetical protein
MAERKPCGKHSELVVNDAVRITRCGCGMLHVHYLASGVSMRMTEETLRLTTAAMITATDQVDDHEGAPVIN